MHPRIEEVIGYLDSQRAALWRAVDDISTDLYETRPHNGGWSIAEIVEHLSLAEANITGFLMKNIEDARASGVGTERELAPVLPTIDTERLLDRSRTLDAPSRLHPKGDVELFASRVALDQTRQRLRDGILAVDGLALSEIAAPHRYLGPLNVYQWLVFVGAHEARHTAQIRAVAAALTGADG